MEATPHFHYQLYKPYGYISQFISHQKGSHKKQFLGSLYDFAEETMAIGRLDENSEGLLLLTTNGKVSAFVTSGLFEKEYFVQVDGVISDNAITALQQGVDISVYGKPYTTKPCLAKKIEIPNLPPTTQKIRSDRHGPTSWVSIILREGKYRQIRKMTAAVGFPTLRLCRYRIDNYTIDGMKAGDCKEISIAIKH